MQGIYKIENIENGYCYIGQAQCIEKRWKQHQNMLKSGTHHAKKLQKAYNDLKNKDSLQYSVLEEVKDVTMLNIKEQLGY